MRLDPREKEILATATHFTVCVFRGRGEFTKCDAASLEEARRVAAWIETSRGAMIYAVNGMAQTLVETSPPVRRVQ